VISWLSLELGRHMASTVYCCEGESAADFNVTSNLLTVHVCDIVWSPYFSNRPVELIDPLLSTVGWDCAVSISGVLENLVSVLKNRVNPLCGILG
jgi:hypothetical protein